MASKSAASVDLNESRQAETRGILIPFVALAVIAVALRFWSRGLMKMRFGLDDYLCVLGLVSLTRGWRACQLTVPMIGFYAWMLCSVHDQYVIVTTFAMTASLTTITSLVVQLGSGLHVGAVPPENFPKYLQVGSNGFWYSASMLTVPDTVPLLVPTDLRHVHPVHQELYSRIL